MPDRWVRFRKNLGPSARSGTYSPRNTLLPNYCIQQWVGGYHGRVSARIWICAPLFIVACTRDNPAFDEIRDAIGGTAEGDGDSGDGDGDPSTGDGDGDGDPSTGDGDGDGDGDGCDGLECNGICVDPQFDNDNCGGCGMPCMVGEVCAQAACLPKKYVFVSTYKFHGNFGGPLYADAACNDLAGGAQLPGSYFAWVSDFQQQGPAMQVPNGEGAYLLPNGPLIASSWEDLLDGQLLRPIDRNQFGGDIEPSPACGMEFAVWTGTTDTGLPTDSNCNSWSAADNMATGRVGNPKTAGPGWSESACAASCGLPLPVYCVQQ
jgi:hypothetical protein